MYSIKKTINYNFEEAIKKTKEALAEEGFGILTSIDVKETLKKKLDVEYDDYVILGACNPDFAYQALQAEKEIGLLLPCNVIVYKDEEEINVSAVKPTEAMKIVDNKEVEKIAEKVESRLEKIINSI